MHDEQKQPVLNAMPPVVMALFIFIAGIEALFVLGSAGLIGDASAIGWRVAALQDFGIAPNYVQAMFNEGAFPLYLAKRLVTYSFVNGSTVSAGVAIALLLAMGRFVGGIFHAVALLIIFFGSSVVGAIAFAYLSPENELLFGSYVGVYGLIGAYSFINWVAMRAQHRPQYHAFSLIIMLMGVQLLFGMLFSVGHSWIAELAAFCTGFVVSFFVAPGGLRRILNAIRRD